MAFHDDGYLVEADFISVRDLDLLNRELDDILSHESHGGSSGYVRAGRNVRTIPNPALSVHSVNLIELAVRAWDLSIQGGVSLPQDYILTNVQIYSEKDNPLPLFWHTDLRKGMIRAQVYLRGGKRDSGAFKFIQRSHMEFFPPDLHRLTDTEMADRLQHERVFDEGPGALVVFDSYGIHGKEICVAERRTVSFEYQQRGSTYPKSTVHLDTSLITDKVLDHVYLLRSAGDTTTYGEHGSQAFHGASASSRLQKGKDTVMRSYQRLKAKRYS